MSIHDHDHFTESAIRHRVDALLRRAHLWQPGTDLLAYMGLARAAVPINGHTQILTYRLPLLGFEDPGIQRLMLSDAYHDALAERHPAAGAFFT